MAAGLLVLATPAFASAWPDAKQGQINGRVAIMGLPITSDSSGNAVPQPASDCTVHLVRTDEQSDERVYPCASWFQPPVGRHLLWLQSRDGISFQNVVHYAGEPFRERGHIFATTLHAAGRLQLDRSVVVPDTATFRVLSLSRVANFRAFDRRLAYDHANRPVLLPAGPAIAAIFDSAGRALAVSRPVAVEQNETTVVTPAPPANGKASVIAVVERFTTAEDLPKCNAELSGAGLHPTPPASDVQTHDRIAVVWYDVTPAPRAFVTLRCEGLDLLRASVPLEPDHISVVRERLDAPRRATSARE